MFRNAHCRVDSKFAHVFGESYTSGKMALKERMNTGLNVSNI